jgi:HNH endonuclease
MRRVYLSNALKKLVFTRACGYCEYCQCHVDFTTEPFSIEHISPVAKGGNNDPINLALACLGCNIFKSDKTQFLDIMSQEIVPIFNPRTMLWQEHFIWDEKLTALIGKTAIGRATIEGLQLNRKQLKNLRRALIAIGEHPRTIL